jgi:hypothetical protein
MWLYVSSHLVFIVNGRVSAMAQQLFHYFNIAIRSSNMKCRPLKLQESTKKQSQSIN